ncbi:Ig-like domain-containing protein [Microbacterium sp. X-17]|uniref:Ig-like domain-containing protein n=1 Tax=Microbacterium sp. X-17 TaxID=3144404 RepID=UPI0031F5CB5B
MAASRRGGLGARAAWITTGAVAAVVGIVATLAAVWPGYDAQQTPLDDASVWALQSGDGRHYARVNTELHELDTVKQVENPSGLAQTPDHLFLFADGDTRYADVSLARPTDLGADRTDAFQPTPAGTVEIESAGDYLAYRTDAGDVSVATLSGGGAPRTIDPYAGAQAAPGADRPRFVADAVAIGPDGTTYAYSSAEGRVIRADARTGEVQDAGAVSAVKPQDPQLAALGSTWALLDAATGRLWIGGRADPIATGTDATARLQRAGPDAGTVYVADDAGLVAVDTGAGTASRIASPAVPGTPAAPAVLAGVAYAAWLPAGAAGGTRWSSTAGTAPLSYGGTALTTDPAPEFRSNGSRMILNETRSGWVWTIPDGELVASSQSWNSDDRAQQRQQQELASQRVVDPRPPVAVDDAFGVRAGRDVVLPVLLNDHDPNQDVLSVDPASVTGLDPGFGTLTVTHAEQQIVVSVRPGARGTATFSYRVTDGTAADGLFSNVATVTLTVVPDDVNNAPVWCGVPGCLAKWPQPQVAPGGTVRVSTLDAWVDPDGDPIYLADAVIQSGVGTVAADPDGTVTYQHPDPNATEPVTVSILLTVSDARGAVAQKELTITVTPTPQLAADSFTVVGVAGVPLTIPLRDHVSGAHGAVTLASASVVNDASASVTTNGAALSLAFSNGSPGSYVVQYTVRDDLGEATGTARVTLHPGDQARISTPPLTAFVRPNEDTTVDVLSAVTNPAGLVLLVSDLRAQADPVASLSVNLVGQNLLRVSGSTDSGQPGPLGVIRYTVSDGTGSPNATTQGEITVVLLPAADTGRPIAVDDAVTVRAGTQIDIPVLDNDTAPGGAQIAVDPSRIVNESGAGLAFGTPQLVRYLAPTTPGTYGISYTIFRVGFPELTGTARIVVTVLDGDTNAAPVPPPLEGRVLSGSTVSIPFSGFEVDPDGDAVALDRILTQPASGSAAISADGSAIVYTSRPGTSGQDSFTYQVRDARGATGTAQVRIGILDAQSDPSPVTYSDYLQVQAGPDSEAVVHPADNDVDPAGGALTLVEVHPNAQPGTAEYDALAQLIDTVDTTSDRVVFHAGLDPGTFSFVYTVRNASGDTAMGLIVMKVVRGTVPDYPVVTDTVLTADTRDAFPQGIDVLSGKVTWSGGDVAGLKLSLWGDVPGVRVDGWRISGAVPDKTLLVPFQVTGTSFTGQQVVSYGFLRVPGNDDIRLSLRPGASPVQVDERGTVEVDMAQAVVTPRGATLQVDGSGVAAGGARAEGRCTYVSGTTIRYDAGSGAPWDDTCTVPVKLAAQTDFTYLTLRVSVRAADPQPILRPASLTVGPGTTTTYDLRQMTTWAGREDWASVVYAAAYTGDQFQVSVSGTILTITAKDAARPGREEPVVVTVPTHPTTAAATLTLTVGPAPSTLPKGGTTSQRCSEGGGTTSCTISVIGTAGEVNPLPGTPLSLVSVTSPANCTGVSFRVADATTVLASWTDTAPGAADCTGSFVVADAQGRQSSGDRNGQVVLDLQGLPADPARIEWTAYTQDSVTLQVVSPGTSYPAVTGYRVTGGGTTVTCAASGACPPISGTNGQKVSYRAVAINAVGDSRNATTPIDAWPYQAPSAPASGAAKPVPNAAHDGGTAAVTVSGIDPSTGSITLARADGSGAATLPVPAGSSEVVFPAYDVGSNAATTILVTPRTRFDVPPIPGGAANGGVLSITASGIGLPRLDPLTFADSNISGFRGTVTVAATVSTPNAAAAQLYIGFADSAANCTPDTAAGGVTGSASTGYPNTLLFSQRTYYACAEYRSGGQSFGVQQIQGTHRLTGTIPTPDGDPHYTVTLGGANGDATRTATLTQAPTLTTAAGSGFEVRYFAGGGAGTTDFAQVLGSLSAGTPITAKTCTTDGADCSAAVAVVPTGAAYLVTATFGATCGAEATVANPQHVSSDDWNYTAPTTAAPTATITFTGALSAFGSITHAYASCP